MNWINRAAVMRRSQFSTVILFETVDPERISQFVHFLKNNESADLIEVFNLKKKTDGTRLSIEILMYDPWEGLIDIRSGQPAGSSEMSELDKAMGGGGMPLQTALRHADAKLKSKTTVFVIKNIAERTPALLSALRSWTVHDDVFKNKSIVFIFAENSSVILDDYTKRLVAVVPIPVSSEDERRTILEKLSENFNLEFDPTLVQASAGLTLHDTEASLLMSYFTDRSFTTEELTHFKTEMIRKTGVLFFEQPRYGFEAVGGYQSTKGFIFDEIISILQNPDKARQMGMDPPRGVLLFGPPGVGKTLIAKALAKELRLPFINFRLEDIMRGIVGETEQRLRGAIDMIEELAPCVVFIDELDRLGHRTDVSTDSGVSRRVFSMLLEWLGQKERKSILIATTNEPDYLDQAMLRPGRLDRKIPLMYPDPEAREEILRVHLNVVRKVPHKGIFDGGGGYRTIVEDTDLFSGAEIEDLVLRSIRKAFKAKADYVTMEYFQAALATFNLNLQDRKRTLQHYLELADKYTDDKTFLQTLKDESEAFDKAEALKREIH